MRPKNNEALHPDTFLPERELEVLMKNEKHSSKRRQDKRMEKNSEEKISGTILKIIGNQNQIGNFNHLKKRKKNRSQKRHVLYGTIWERKNLWKINRIRQN